MSASLASYGLENRTGRDEMPNANDASPKGPHVAATLATLAIGGAIAALLASASVPCAFARVLHQPCPGCGSTRAMLALARGDVAGAFVMNPAAPFMVGFAVILAGQGLSSMWTTGTFVGVGHGTLGRFAVRAMVACAVVQVLVWFARFFGFLGGPVPV